MSGTEAVWLLLPAQIWSASVVMVQPGDGSMDTSLLSLQVPQLLVTVTFMVMGLVEPAVQVMELVPWPVSMVPSVNVQL